MPEPGLRSNWRQFWLLVLINAFVGAMLGLERAVVPLIASREFGIASVSVSLSFIVSFGVVKALSNLAAGRASDRVGRRPLLIGGWLAGLPVPWIIILAPSWSWIVMANVLLGINQGLCWSAAVIMKIDLAGPARRGLATGMNEFAGYLAMALSTAASGWIAQRMALRPYPFYLGAAIAVIALLLSVVFVRETRGMALAEAGPPGRGPQPPRGPQEASLSFRAVFTRVTWKDFAFFRLSQAGFVNNLNDVVTWGLLPLLAIQRGSTVQQAALLGSTYLAVWGASQLGTGPLSDRVGRRPLIAGGLLLQAAGIAMLGTLAEPGSWLAAVSLMGLGTGMAYPALLAAVSDRAHPSWRATALGVYRLWRDGGYAAGAVLAGLLGDWLGVPAAIIAIAVLTAASGAVAAAGRRAQPASVPRGGVV